MDDRGTVVRLPAALTDFSLPQNVYTDSGFHPASYSVPKVLSLGAKWVGREADHSPPSSAEFKTEWCYTSAPPNCLVACTGIIVIFEGTRRCGRGGTLIASFRMKQGKWSQHGFIKEQSTSGKSR